MSNEEWFADQRLKTFFKKSSDCKLIYKFEREPFVALANAPREENKEKYIHKMLDEVLYNIDLTESFYKKLVILYEEILVSEVLIYFHSWFCKKCCKIENIVIIPVLNVGVHRWYKKYTEVIGTPQMTVIDAPWTNITLYKKFYDSLNNLSPIDIKKDIKYLYSFYGGGWGNLERDALVSMISLIPNGKVDYSGFVESYTELDNYLEQLTYFADRSFVDKVLEKRSSLNFTGFTGDIKETNMFVFRSNEQWKIDQQTAFSIVRETLNNTGFACFTEKTVRAFVHLQMVIPLGGVGTVDELQHLGFKFADIFDYSFQYEPIYINRIYQVLNQMLLIHDTYSLKDIEEYMRANMDSLNHNSELISSGWLANHSADVIIKELTR